MILIDAITYLRTNILDDLGGIGADWDEFAFDDESAIQLRWTNEELVANINEAVRQVYRRILPVKEVNTDFSITSVVDQRTYTLDPRILQIEGVKNTTTNKSLNRIDVDALFDLDDFDTLFKDPTCYIPNYDTGSITLYPIPDSVATYNLLMYRLPLKELDWDDNESTIELREEFVIPMLYYAAHIAYDKDEANILDPDRSVYFLQKFNQEFTVTNAYSDTRKRRTNNRSVKYGGL